MIRLSFPEIIDRHLACHGLHQGLSWGWIATIWLAHILSQGDHRKLPVQAWVKQAQETLMRITGIEVCEMDFTDDRLTTLLRRLSKPETWQVIETDMGRNILRVYELEPKVVRLDPTTISGYHKGGEDSLFEYGHSKDDPTLRQVKAMVAALDPLGLPLVTQVVAGSQADDPLYIPAVDQVLQIIEGTGMLFVGDSKMSALGIRAYVHHLKQHYLCPLTLTGNTAEDMEKWIQAGNEGTKDLQSVYVEDDKGERKLLAEGYTFERSHNAEVNGEAVEWTERVFVVRSESYRRVLLNGLEKRLEHATTRLQALTPAPGRGKRQIREESDLIEAAQAILEEHKVEGLLTYTFERQEKHQTKYIGRGRSGPDRPTREIVTVRYQITTIIRQEEAISDIQKTFGWRAYATNAPTEQLSLEQAVLTYRDEWLIERGFHRLKGAPLSLTPLFVKRDDQVVGLTNLLSIAVRLLTLLEFVVRCKLKQAQEKLVGLLPQNPKKGIDNPTTERLLKQFDNITLTIVHLPDRIIRHITPLTPVQTRILQLCGLSPEIYSSLGEN
ncbi:MAG: IS1634 family transposase [Anaerolineales bacterium]|nr:IS1634 family transposase [Anaerolineales bacterium]